MYSSPTTLCWVSLDESLDSLIRYQRRRLPWQRFCSMAAIERAWLASGTSEITKPTDPMTLDSSTSTACCLAMICFHLIFITMKT
ncbi:MAG: hypothetical protein ACJAW7_003302 [Candidatus Azotimanducaceae bacterium]|jgi:hypothetical protein